MFANPLAQALREISGQGAKGFEQMMEGLKPYLDPMREAKSWLGVPAFGFLREHQEHYQKMMSGLIDYQEQTTAFEDVVGTSQFNAHWTSDGGAERLTLNWMTPNGFDFLGVPPRLVRRLHRHIGRALLRRLRF